MKVSMGLYGVLVLLPVLLAPGAVRAQENGTPAANTPDSRGSENPVGLRTPSPRYPPVALRAGAGGEVTLEISLDATGMVVHVEVYKSSGHASIDASAVAEAYFWEFKPAMQQGKAVHSRVRTPVAFNPAN